MLELLVEVRGRHVGRVAEAALRKGLCLGSHEIVVAEAVISIKIAVHELLIGALDLVVDVVIEADS